MMNNIIIGIIIWFFGIYIILKKNKENDNK